MEESILGMVTKAAGGQYIIASPTFAIKQIMFAYTLIFSLFSDTIYFKRTGLFGSLNYSVVLATINTFLKPLVRQGLHHLESFKFPSTISLPLFNPKISAV